MRGKRTSRAALRRARARRRARKRLAQKPSSFLRALTASALALPGMTLRAAADAPPTQVRADYHYSRYEEDSLPARQVAAGDRSRYDIDIHQFRIEGGITDNIGLNLDFTHETMTGATPWYVTPGPNGTPMQVMTGATIDEARTDALLSGDYYLDRGKATLSGGFSIENDYLSFGGGIGGERQYNDKNTTVSGGLSFTYDKITPSGTDKFPERPTLEHKQGYNAVIGMSQVLGDSTIGQSSLTYQFNTGFLSDPYKLAYVAGTPEQDARPNHRHQLAWLTQFRHHFHRLNGSLHLDYQLYADDWKMLSHTVDLAWYQTLFDKLLIVPSARYYSQSQAYFYAPFYGAERHDELRSSDYRLSPFGAYSWGVKIEYPFETWQLAWAISAAYQRYASGGDLALQSVSIENPGLVSYNLFTVGLRLRF